MAKSLQRNVGGLLRKNRGSRLKTQARLKNTCKSANAKELKTAEAIVRKTRHPDCVIALSNFSTSHTRFRDMLTRLRARGTRVCRF